jgi:N-acetylmuramoyl-L-alanine amidase
VGEIYKDDLNDSEQARATFQDFLRRYPGNRLAEDAQQAIAELDRQASAEKKAAHKKSGKESAAKKRENASFNENAETSAESDSSAAQEPSEPRSGRLSRVTGIRHWSTPDYTRVAIDLESGIKFGSQRISGPDRIFFDLRGTKLASTLVGKSFDVDDGFLKKIRVAQFQPGRTRVVLEVDDLSDYEAFLLPNPYRLIIDIHGKDASKSARAREKMDAVTATADVEAPPKASSKTNAPSKSDIASKTDVAKAVAPSELKADLKALAGKPAVKGEQIHNDQGVPSNVASKSDLDSENAPADAPAPAASDAKSSASTVKKVVVDADDDDDSPPVKVAKLEPRARRLRSSAGSAAFSKKGTTEDSDSPSDDASAIDSTRLGKASGKPSARLTKKQVLDLGMREAKPTASGDRSLIRALGLKIGRIVIDPGHGGHDTGTIGPNGLEEKDLVLEVGRRLGKLLETRLGAEVVYTRKDDTFIPLETRTAIANQQRADLFISIHANSSHDSGARGVETYYLNFTSSPEALEVAARENAVSEKSIYELQDLVKKIAMKEKIEESREFAGDVQESLHRGLAAKTPAIRNRGVKKAPFIVLIGANMPSILAEISFVSNPADEHRMVTSEYRQRIAESLYHGIAKYVDGLSGVKVASKLDKAAGQ